jgi:hypothetical protein
VLHCESGQLLPRRSGLNSVEEARFIREAAQLEHPHDERVHPSRAVRPCGLALTLALREYRVRPRLRDSARLRGARAGLKCVSLQHSG